MKQWSTRGPTALITSPRMIKAIIFTAALLLYVWFLIDTSIVQIGGTDFQLESNYEPEQVKVRIYQWDQTNQKRVDSGKREEDRARQRPDG